jgi:hypothetical protein
MNKMPSSSFKRKQYGQVKPVPIKPAVLPKPPLFDLRFQYKGISKSDDATFMDYVANIYQWYEALKAWHLSMQKKMPITTTQAKLLVAAAKLKTQGNEAVLLKDKHAAWTKYIMTMESYGKNMVKLPTIKPYLDERKVWLAKHLSATAQIAPRFDKLRNLFAEMFPSCRMAIEVVPQIKSGDGQELKRKIDPSISKMFYSRRYATEMVKTINKEGVLRVAIEECYHFARAMSMKGVENGQYIVSEKDVLIKSHTLMHELVTWAQRGEKPKKLVRLTRKKNRQKVQPTVISGG